MTKSYNRDALIRTMIAKHGGTPWCFLKSKPTKKYISCDNCHHVTVRVTQERYGDGTTDHINWTVDVWIGRCQRRECRHLNFWIELTPSDELDRENRRLLIATCDRELKSLQQINLS